MRRHLHTLLASPLALACVAAPALAWSEGPTAQVADGPPSAPCTVRGGWSSDPDPAGLNIRSKPQSTAPVVGRLPPPSFDPDWGDYFAAGFRIIESRDGWFHIEADEDLPGGWISGRYVDFALQTDKAFEAPDPTSLVVASSWNAHDGIRQFHYRHPTECRGEWMRLTVSDWRNQEREGWVRGICANQETTCDGAVGDYYEDSERDMPRND